MQQPTLTKCRIRSTSDAHRVFHAVQVGHLERIKRRLDAEERGALCSGCIYVWEERGSHTVDVTGLGIERFTEGKRWTASRVRDEFLFYYQIKPNDAPNDWDQLIKQTYSAWVNKKEGKRKWHLTAYFTEKTVNDLRTIDDIPSIGHLHPPPGQYQSARVVNRRPPATRKRSDASKRTVVDRTFASFSSQSMCEPVTMHDPYNPPNLSPQRSQDAVLLHAPSSSQHSPHHTLPTPSVAQLSSYIQSAPPLTYGNPHEARKSNSPTIPSVGAMHSANPAWSGGPMSYPIYSAPTDTHLSTPRTISLPPVNTMYDEEQLFPASCSPGPDSSPSHIVYSNPYSLETGAPFEPSYELASVLASEASDSDGSKSSLSTSLALAPMYDLERRRSVYHRDSLDDRALRSFL